MTKNERTVIEIAFEKAEAAKRLLAEREKLEAWKRDTVDLRYNQSVESWLNHRVKKSHDNAGH